MLPKNRLLFPFLVCHVMLLSSTLCCAAATLKNLVLIHDGNSDYVDDNKTTINFEKMVLQFDQTNELMDIISQAK